MSDAGRLLMIVGVVLLAVGALMTFAGRGLRLPGDIIIHRGEYSVYIPVATSILLSVILTVVLSLLVRR